MQHGGWAFKYHRHIYAYIHWGIVQWWISGWDALVSYLLDAWLHFLLQTLQQVPDISAAIHFLQLGKPCSARATEYVMRDSWHAHLLNVGQQ
jgi:hypothetical protein